MFDMKGYRLHMKECRRFSPPTVLRILYNFLVITHRIFGHLITSVTYVDRLERVSRSIVSCIAFKLQDITICFSKYFYNPYGEESISEC